MEAKPELPTITFPTEIVPKQEQVVEVRQDDPAGQLVEQAFSQAVISKVANDEKIQEKLLDSAEQVIDNKVDAIKNRAEEESTTTYFNNRKGACECFGYDEKATKKWAVKLMDTWHNVMTCIWLFIGFFTFAPITFVAKKIKVIFKASWLAILIALIIYAGVATSPIWIKYIANLIGKN